MVEALSKNVGRFEGLRFAFFSHLDFNLYRFRLPLMQELISQGAHVLAIAPPGEFSGSFIKNNVDFVPFEIDRMSFNPLAVRKTIHKLTCLLIRLQPDLLHTFTLRPNAYGGIAGRRAGVPVIISTVTGLGSLYAEGLGVKGAVARWGINGLTRTALSKVSAVVFQNPDDFNYYLGKKLCRPDQAKLIIGSGVDIDSFSAGRISQEQRDQLRRRLGIAQSEIVVTMIARLLIPKGVREFVAAAEHLSHRAKFILIGDSDPGNPSTLALESLKSSIKKGALILPGHQENISEWLAISDIYALPSYREGLPRTVLEAMAMGLPVITTDAPGCRETVMHEENGLLIPPRQVEPLIQALERMINSPKERQRMGRRSREIAEQRFSHRVIFQQYLDLYQELCQARIQRASINPAGRTDLQ